MEVFKNVMNIAGVEWVDTRGLFSTINFGRTAGRLHWLPNIEGFLANLLYLPYFGGMRQENKEDNEKLKMSGVIV